MTGSSTAQRRPVTAGARGIALPAMVFALVIVSLMLAAGLQLLGQSQHTYGLQVQAARAMAAAKSATELGRSQLGQALQDSTLPAAELPACPPAASLALPAPLAGLQVQLACTREPASGSLDEGGLKLASYRLLGDASVGTPGSDAHVRRRFEQRLTLCRNPGGTPPAYAC